ncbi:DNA primase/helicase [Synechococcus phage MA10]|uniref:DnaB-like replicative helicase n=1 Tax=Synechococcus phage S-H34 TaxID=2718942 RepID=A0A6G8R6J6_9CAUD|nr:DnaB-like replicative helicase [Synechococcus phage S-H34]QIN97039.1 DNA primase/helicase [Synechococcus phage S-H34]
MLTALETTILKGLIHDETYTRRVLPYVKDAYFEASTGRTYFGLCKEYFGNYDSCATADSLKIALGNMDGLSDDEFRELGECFEELVSPLDVNTDWLIDETEKWCKERAVYLALMDAISIHDGTDKDNSRDAIPQILSDALAVGFDDTVGHDYLADYQERYDFYHLKEERTSFGLDYFDKITKGGIPNKTLNIALAGTGVGKSLFMCDFAAKVLMQGKNVLYITMEMAEERIAERIDANLLDVNVQDIRDIPKQIFQQKVQKLQGKTQGKFFIKEYPTASAHAGHFDALLKELQLKKGFKPDIIFIDYLNICSSQRYKAGTNANSYTIVKAIAEELRGLAGKYDVPIVSATQTTRSGYGNSDVGLTDTSESFGLPATADLMFALISSEELEQMGQIMVKQLKNRYNDPTMHRKFVVGIDRAKMRLFDVEQSQQAELIDEKPAVDYTSSVASKFQKKDSFADFSF